MSDVGFILESSAFEHGGAIDPTYTCDGADLSPPLAWHGVPPGTRSFVLIADDPDAPVGIWVHWVYYDIPASVTRLSEGLPAVDRPPSGGTHGITDFRRLGYGGPCPPGGTHRYFFKLYALDTVLGLEPWASKQQVKEAMEGHVLDTAKLMGTYARR